jgi:very-short-patch-repair endonuclease
MYFEAIDNENFENKYGDLCSGWNKELLCLVYDHCRNSERLFCKNVVSKIFSNGAFKAQFPILLAEKVRKIDFVFLTQDGQPVAIEVDDTCHHTNISSDKFGEQLRRQNALTLAGWKVLRYSFKQACDEHDQCINEIQQLKPCIHEPIGHHEHITRNFRRDFFEIFAPCGYDAYFSDKFETNKYMKKIGATYSDLRDRWYFLEGQKIPNKFPFDNWDILRQRIPILGIWN